MLVGSVAVVDREAGRDVREVVRVEAEQIRDERVEQEPRGQAIGGSIRGSLS